MRAIVDHATVGVAARAVDEGVLASEADLRRDVVARCVEIHHHLTICGPLLNSLHVRRNNWMLRVHIIFLVIEHRSDLALHEWDHNDVGDAEFVAKQEFLTLQLGLDLLQGLRVNVDDLLLLLEVLTLVGQEAPPPGKHAALQLVDLLHPRVGETDGAELTGQNLECDNDFVAGGVEAPVDLRARHIVVLIDGSVPALRRSGEGMQADLEDLVRKLLFLEKEPDFLAVSAPAVVVTKQSHLHALLRVAEKAEARL